MCHFHFPPSLFTFWLPVEIIETSSSSSITTQTRWTLNIIYIDVIVVCYLLTPSRATIVGAVVCSLVDDFVPVLHWLPPLCFLIAIVVTVVVVFAPVFDVVSPYCDIHSSSLSLSQIHCLKVTGNNPFEICLCGMKMVIVDLGDQICHFGSWLSTVFFSLWC